MSNINFYKTIKQTPTINPQYNQHEIQVPFRALITGPSGCGKTLMLCNLLYKCFNKTFHEIIICVKSSDEQLYNLIEDKLPNVRFYENGAVPNITEFSSEDPLKKDRLKRIDDLQRLIVFDDLLVEKEANKAAVEYYIKGRKVGFSMIYIGQTFFDIPKKIRTQCNYFVLGRGFLKQDLKSILSVFSTRLTLDEFQELYNTLTANPLDTLLINIDKRFVRANIDGEKISI